METKYSDKQIEIAEKLVESLKIIMLEQHGKLPCFSDFQKFEVVNDGISKMVVESNIPVGTAVIASDYNRLKDGRCVNGYGFYWTVQVFGLGYHNALQCPISEMTKEQSEHMVGLIRDTFKRVFHNAAL